GAINFNSPEAWSASTFAVDEKGEKISAVSFHTPNANVTYEIWVSLTGNYNEKRLAKTGKIANAGYVTVDLDKPMDITGDKFSVMVRFKTSGVVNLSLEKNVPGYLENATAKKGETFASRDGFTWLDVAEKMKDASLCVRAWTVTSEKLAAASVPTIGSLSAQVASKLGLSGTSALESLGCYAKLPDKSASKPATREEFAYILARALQLPNAPGKSPLDIGDSFARTAIMALINKKITSIGVDGTFHPTDPISQTEADKWLTNAVALKTAKK
ncbi:MAG: lectin like domain-containing protein, partial [Clostridiales bacterium]|nr:lectin like domain-containing protein [Clostridiales bacterium]